MTYVFVTHDYYQLKILTTDLQNRNFENISKKLINYIEISKKFSPDKSFMIRGIFEAIQYSASRAVTQEDYNHLQDTFVEFVKLDPRIYDSNVWLAKALFDDNPEQALILLKKAIDITPSREEAYRELIHLSSQLKDSKEFTRENYCDNYFSAQIGGYSDLHFGGMLGSNNLKKFGVKFNTIKKKEEIYINNGIQLNNFVNYEFILSEAIDLNNIDLFLNIIPAIKFSIKKIVIHSGDTKLEIPPNMINILTRSSYVDDDEKNLSVILTNLNDEIINFSFNQSFLQKHQNIFLKVDKVNLVANFIKLNLTNSNFCN